MILWDTILKREMLHDFPCTSEGCDYRLGEIHFCVSEDTPACEIEDVCPLRPIYEEYRALRAVVEAELQGTTVEQTAKGYREMAAQRHLSEWRRERSAKRAKAWEGIA